MKLPIGLLLMPLVMGAAPYPILSTGPGCATGCAPGGAPLPPGLPDYHMAPTPATQSCPPSGPPSAVLMMRVLVPENVKVSFQPGMPEAKTFSTPINAGFRPGYRYRLALSNIPRHPERTLYPEVEVLGSLVPRSNLNPFDFAAPISFTQQELETVLLGGFLTKIVYLEDPTNAMPVQSDPEMPIESSESSLDEATNAALKSGRLVAIIRLGDRVPAEEELVRGSIPGTLLLPGEQALGAPPVPPMFSPGCIPFYDPIAGPKPLTEECFTDGGDVGPRLGIGPRRQLGGLNPTDVALEYSILGFRKVATSNRVCICSPRFAIRKVEVLPGGMFNVRGYDRLKQASNGVMVQNRTPVLGLQNRVKAVGNQSRERPGMMLTIQGLEEVIGFNRPQILATTEGVQAHFKYVEVEEITSHPNELIVTKSVEPAGAVKIGDEVTITIHYRNGTLHSVSDLLLSDSLSGRLSYVPGSAAADRPSNVTTTENEAGSVIVRFEIPGPIPSGHTGIVRFRAKVR